MGIRFRCHHCAHKLNIKAYLAGKRGICPHCSGRFRIPAEDRDQSIALDDIAEGDSQDLLPSSNLSSQPIKLRFDEKSLFYVKPPSGGIYGPADLQTIETWIVEKRVTSDTVLAQVGSNTWQSAEDFFPDSFG